MKTIEVTGMNANNVSKVVSGLSLLLANLQVHYTNLRNLHWNVKGKGFFVLHEQYEELYNDVAGKIDEVAERMLQLDATPEPRSRSTSSRHKWPRSTSCRAASRA